MCILVQSQYATNYDFTEYVFSIQMVGVQNPTVFEYPTFCNLEFRFHCKSQRFNNWTAFDHLNTELV